MQAVPKRSYHALFPEQPHQDVEVQAAHVPASQPVRAVPATRQLLFFMPSHSASECQPMSNLSA